MSSNRHKFGAILAMLGFALLAAPFSSEGGTADTTAAVGVAAKNGLAELKPVILALRDAEAVLSKMETDPAWQKACYELVHKGDKAGLAAFVQRAAPNSTVEVLAVGDWTATLSFHVFGHKVDLCASSEKGCSGTAASLGVSSK
jgi:hypothetical protein